MTRPDSPSQSLRVLAMAARRPDGRAQFSSAYQKDLSLLETLGMITSEPIHKSSRTGEVDVYAVGLTAEGWQLFRDMSGSETETSA